MPDLIIQAFPGNYEEVVGYDDAIDDQVREELWDAIGDEDWSFVTTVLRDHDVLEDNWRVRKARLLREPDAEARGRFRDRLWVRVTRPRGQEAHDDLELVPRL